jgi:predicted  nucleic acid-binding Zn-ribbon protein
MARRKTLPQVSPKVANELKPLVTAIKEIIETGEGVRGDPLDRKITLRDLVDGGIVKIKGGLSPNNPGSLEPSPPPPNLSVPPAPTGFNAIGGFDGRIDLTWDIPGSLYSNHAYTNIYRAEEDNFANAILVGREAGAFYTDVVRDDVVPKPYYYWISFTSTSDIEGPLNSPSGTMAQALDIDYIVDLLDGKISESELANELLTPIQAIPGIQNTLLDHDARIDTIQTAVNEVLNLPAFDSAVSYDPGDTVKYNGYAWRALVTMTAPSPTPVEGANWTQIGAYQTYDDLLSANAVAIADNATRITTAEGQITSISSDVTSLQTDVSDNDSSLAAQALSISSLESRVTTNEGDISSVSASITLLENGLTTAEGDITANSTALNLLDNRVTSAEGTILANSADITQLQADVQALDVDGNAQALQDLDVRVTANEQDITAVASDVTTLTASVNGNTSALQTKAEVSAVQNLEDDITVLSAQYTIKLDVNGRVAGIGLANVNGASEFIVASDAVYFIDPGQSIAPFDPNANYSSMAAVRDTQLVFGYAEVEGFKRFVINVPAYIPEGYIESGMVGAISFGKITTATGVPVTTVSGKLKADYIDVDNLAVASAATFYGDAQSGNYAAGSAGWRIQQSGTVEFYNGTFRGRIEANTGYISQNLQIGGTSQDIGDVLQMAQDADAGLSIVDGWKKPGYTLIDGNKIFTGDAYVDTLQIKGQAVTFPRGRSASSYTQATISLKTILSLSASLTGAPIIVSASFSCNGGTTRMGGYLTARIVCGSTIIAEEYVAISSTPTGNSSPAGNTYLLRGSSAFSVFVQSPPSGTYSLQVRTNQNGNDTGIFERSLTIIEAKR